MKHSRYELLLKGYILYLVNHPEFERYSAEDIKIIAHELTKAYESGENKEIKFD